MEKVKIKQLDAERVAVIVGRLQELSHYISVSCKPPSSLRWQAHDPGLPDIAMFPHVRAIMELPDKEQVTEAMFESILHALPASVAQWHEDVKGKVGRELRKSYERTLQNESNDVGLEMDLGKLSDLDLTDLAVWTYDHAMFGGLGCHFTYPALTGHLISRDFMELLEPDQEPDKSGDLYLRALLSLTKLHPWCLRDIVCFTSGDILAQVRTMAGLCGLDWKTTTWMEMDERKERFICTCHLCTDSSKKEVMDWRRVVNVSNNLSGLVVNIDVGYVYR